MNTPISSSRGCVEKTACSTPLIRLQSAMTYQLRTKYEIARDDFRRARRLAATNEIIRKLRGQPVDLLPFDEVSQHIHAQDGHQRGLQHIPLEAIVGSVGRYADFTRDFLPRSGALQERWARVKSKFHNLEDMPPIQVYQVGEVYFVLDGNHRVSIAKEHGATHIRAYVTELESTIQITPETDLDSMILTVEQAEFLEKTHFDALQPTPDLRITSPGKYKVLEQQILNLHQQRDPEQEHEIPFEETARLWYQDVYLPVVEIIQTHRLLVNFPGRTETDLYVWIVQHQEFLSDALGWEINPEDAAIDLTDQFSSRPDRVALRWRDRILESVIPATMEAGPRAGEWRQQQLDKQRHNNLFSRILVALSGAPNSWQALEQAIVFAQREDAQLLGLHIVPDENALTAPATQMVRQKFEEYCEAANIPGELAIESGEITPTIIERARWSDLVVVHLAHPPSQQILGRLAPGFHRLVQRCPRPILVVPQSSPALDNLLLAYDGSSKADEALFIAAYLADKWDIPLTVLMVLTGESFPQRAAARARGYLDTHKIIGDIHFCYGLVDETIINIAQEARNEMIIMGGYSRTPMLEVVVGSSVNQVLRAATCPVLICR